MNDLFDICYWFDFTRLYDPKNTAHKEREIREWGKKLPAGLALMKLDVLLWGTEKGIKILEYWLQTIRNGQDMGSREPTGMQTEMRAGKGNGSYQTESGVLTLLLLFSFCSLSGAHQWRRSGVLQRILSPAG
jgi:hypothetical protein